MEFDASIYNDDSVPDPTDFPPDTSAPGLRSLDGSFRCTICGEVYDAPVTLPCGHCFCSCVTMAIKQECPSCRKAANEGHLRPNPAIEEVVAAWKASRCVTIKEEERRRAISHQRGTPSKSVKKRKLTHERERSSSPDIECIPNPSRGPKTLTATNDILNSPCKPRKYKLSKLNTADSSTATSDTNEDELPAGSTDDSVNCPICEKRVVFRRMNQHIDSGCKDGLAPDPASANQSKQQWMKLMGAQQSKGKTKSMLVPCLHDLFRTLTINDDEFPLPKATYGTLKDKKIKEMLLEHDLPVQGERNQWIARHQRWVMVYNANLDRSIPNRKTKGELRRELKRWEEDLKKKKNSVSDIVVYEKKQKPEFDRLIQMARQSKSKTSVPKDAFLPASLVRISSDGRERDSSPACSSSSSSVAEANVIVLDSEGERQNS
ncbi:hypothetical protein BDQ12DRAFT_612703 [Crucibulum laeve]|uniref:RING-type domain-containing protein n=1 Tax=Crucibulum laeve TaxID=68775 RepID=A0A5C3LP34_9AGAR|nr:hypothetical protein BDQ12DRAFT_612703 [Crucibulum laeve]